MRKGQEVVAEVFKREKETRWRWMIFFGKVATTFSHSAFGTKSAARLSLNSYRTQYGIHIDKMIYPPNSTRHRVGKTWEYGQEFEGGR